MVTRPKAKVEWANKPSKASPGRFVTLCKLIKNIATTADMRKTANEIFISNDKANVTPKRAECANVSPKNESLLQIVKHPKGPVTIATPKPAIKALIKKSSSIKFFSFLLYHLLNVYGRVCVHKSITY